MTRFLQEVCDLGRELHFRSSFGVFSLQSRVELPKVTLFPDEPPKHGSTDVRVVPIEGQTPFWKLQSIFRGKTQFSAREFNLNSWRNVEVN